MASISLMIVDHDADFRQELEKELCDSYTVYHASNGRQARLAVEEINPDVIVLDLMLTELDGVSLLHEIRNAGLRPMVLAVTRFYNDYVLETAQELGIGYIIRKPCDPLAVCQRVRDLSRRMNPKRHRPVDAYTYVTEQLNRLSFSIRHKGYDYLRQAVLMMCQTPDISITKELYPNVGATHGSNAMQVERSIRSAINAAWEQGADGWKELFGTGPDGKANRPSNGAFIARLADDLRFELSDSET